MERNDEKIKQYIRSIIALLRNNNELPWALGFEKTLSELDNNTNKQEVVRSILRAYKGGMGSFADLVLHKNMKMLVEENDELDELKDKLYEACLNFLEKKEI